MEIIASDYKLAIEKMLGELDCYESISDSDWAFIDSELDRLFGVGDIA
jgi:ribosome assembly protein YihI (activator of Der GTPase)